MSPKNLQTQQESASIHTIVHSHQFGHLNFIKAKFKRQSSLTEPTKLGDISVKEFTHQSSHIQSSLTEAKKLGLSFKNSRKSTAITTTPQSPLFRKQSHDHHTTMSSPAQVSRARAHFKLLTAII